MGNKYCARWREKGNFDLCVYNISSTYTFVIKTELNETKWHIYAWANKIIMVSEDNLAQNRQQFITYINADL